ncbi:MULTISPECIES: MOSC domain-containing protein [unclassified Phyllobacterium]|uniref:MOSC domain-containing protein n=1 Tax=Phyllobacterium TaxID=28100 RepID=UPI0015FCCE2D|nr:MULTISPECIES: MOSC domain-containing protein [unclassified Phyllobacterium]MBA8900431.1 MOSC domain-containing protein YiiM [Phyllobacterium sp. P30BS-XVII]UGX86392.1 MOSC domain-containing protein [Phyllobacterium sp. T1293]
MTIKDCTIEVLVGTLAPLGEKKVPSGIAKKPVRKRLWLGNTGLEGDAQGDLKRHGGVDKAVHHYPFDHYEKWVSDIGAVSLLEGAGAFGENISTTGLDETNVALGDVFQLGGARVEVSQGRQPCWKLNSRFGIADMSMRVQKTGRTGWYYRVVETGYVAPEDTLTLVDRTSPEWTIHRLWRTLYIDTMNREELAQMAALERLPDGWRRYAERRLASGKVEDWSSRLTGEQPA